MRLVGSTTQVLLSLLYSAPYTLGHVIDSSSTPLLKAARVAEFLSGRSLPNAPDGYTPVAATCPDVAPYIRSAAILSPNETDWLSVRRPQTVDAMRTLFQQLNITGLDTDSYFDTHSSNFSMLPNIGIAVSGGGYRAMLNGAGTIAAFDNRTVHNSTEAAALSGLLQSSTYLAGLSGGSWLVGSLYTNNFTSIQQIIDEDTGADGSGGLWQFGNSILEGPETGSIQLLSTINYYSTIADQVGGKRDAGYNITITDYWGRALSFQLVNASAGGASYTFSSIAQQDWFTDGSVPLPLIVSDGRDPGEVIVSTNSTVYEFSPWSLGSYDPSVFGFVPLEYLGTNFSDGSVPSGQQCVKGLDNVGYVMGTSSSLFNQFLLQLNSSGNSGVLYSALEKVLTGVATADDDIADYPNPFYNWNNDSNPNTDSFRLTLVDGGLDGQNIPLHPLIQPLREVDIIFAVDSSADTNSSSIAPNWPNGTSLVTTYERQFNPIGNNTVFPSVPDQETFVNLGLNTRPTFFGCNASNMTGPAPLIVYLPNAPYSFDSNVSTFDLSYSDSERNSIIQNGYNVATMGNGSVDSMWPTCVGCAILNRSFNRTNTTIPDVCEQCFDRYCWDGTRNSTYTEYNPDMKLEATSDAVPTRAISSIAVVVAGIAAVILTL